MGISWDGITLRNKIYKDIVALLLITLLSCLVWTGQYVRRDLWDQDEARYTYVAWEMDQTDSWFMPVRNGQPYAHKPPLMFWLIKASTLISGGEYNGVSGRLPTLLGSILALWAFLKLAIFWFDRQTAWRGLLILLTSSLFWKKGGMGQIDMLLLGLEMCAIYFLVSAHSFPQRWRYLIAFSLMGLAILAKGPVGLIVPIGIYSAITLAGGYGRKVPGWHWLWGICLALLFPACWLLLAKLNGAPDSYFHELLFKQNIDRFAGNFGGHVRPFYYYIPHLFMDFLPWTFLVPGSLVLLFRQAAKRAQLKSILGWIFFVVLFFSLSSSKRNLYILSVYPAASLLVASALPELKTLSSRWQRNTVYPLLSLLGLVATGVLIAPWVVDVRVPHKVFLILAILLFVGLALLLRQFRTQRLTAGWVYLAVGVFFINELYLGCILWPTYNPIKTPARFAEAVQKIVPEDQPLLIYRKNGEIFSLYSKRRGKQVSTIEALLLEMHATRHGVVLFKMERWNKLKNQLKHLGTANTFTMGKESFCWLEYDIALTSRIQ